MKCLLLCHCVVSPSPPLYPPPLPPLPPLFQGGLFEAAGSLLSGSFKRVQGMRRMRLQNCKYMCYITVVAAFMLLVLYFLVGRAMS